MKSPAQWSTGTSGKTLPVEAGGIHAAPCSALSSSTAISARESGFVGQ